MKEAKGDAKTDKKDGDEKDPDETAKDEALQAFKIPEAVTGTFRVLNAITPRTKDLDNLTTQLIARDLLSETDRRQAGWKLRELAWGEVLGVASAWIAFFLGLATLRFVTRSY